MSEDCIICMCEMEHKITTSCGHSFCKDCITNWCQENENCPLCRKNIKIEIKNHNFLPTTRIGILRKMIFIEKCLKSTTLTQEERNIYIQNMTILYDGLNV